MRKARVASDATLAQLRKMRSDLMRMARESHALELWFKGDPKPTKKARVRDPERERLRRQRDATVRLGFHGLTLDEAARLSDDELCQLEGCGPATFEVVRNRRREVIA